jgi:hypothetical protein
MELDELRSHQLGVLQKGDSTGGVPVAYSGSGGASAVRADPDEFVSGEVERGRVKPVEVDQVCRAESGNVE